MSSYMTCRGDKYCHCTWRKQEKFMECIYENSKRKQKFEDL